MTAADREATRWGALARAVWREARASRGRLLFFTLCLSIGVAAVTGVSTLVATIRGGMAGESRELLAGDLRVSARRPLPDTVDEFFTDRPHRRADVVEMSAMAALPAERVADDAARSRLVELKVVDANYPLYGALEVDPPAAAADLGDDRVFVAPELAAELGVAVGDDLMLGGAAFEVAALVTNEPDRMDFAMTLGPRVFVGPDGLARTNLFGEKSRVRYISLYAVEGDPGEPELQRLEDELEATLSESAYVGVRHHYESQPSVRRGLDRVEDYLGLVALLSLLLGGIGVSQIVRAWLSGRTRSVAVMRCLGFRAREVALVYLGNVAMLAVAGCVLGGVVGSLLPTVVSAYAPDLLETADRGFHWAPFARGVGLGLVVAILFSLPPLAAVWSVPPAAVLRAEAAPLSVPRVVRWGGPVALFVGVLVSARVQGGEWIPAIAFSLGLLLLGALLYGAANLVSRGASRLPRGRFGPYAEHGLAALARPGAGTAGAVVALGIGVMVVVSMWVVESRLSHALRSALPQDAPSVFLVDVQPDQWPGVRAELERRDAQSLSAVPVVMSRLRAIDGRDVKDLARESRDAGRASWVFTREQRLTFLDALPDSNRLIEGALWTDPERAEVSLEREFAEDLGVGLGAVLEMEVQGVPFEFTVTSLREVDWQSFEINFFLVVEPGYLEDAPHFRLAAARVEPVEAEFALQNALAGDYPNVTMLRVRPILEKLAGVLDRLAFAIRSLGSFTIVAGLVILAGAVGTSALRRTREAALLKTLGVTRGGVTRLFAFEYALVGVVAGTLGAAGAVALSESFLRYIADVDGEVAWSVVPIAAVVTGVMATLSGLAASVRALTTRPMESLRG